MIADVGRTLRALEAATVSQLAAELAAPRREVEAALDFWVHRGNARECIAVAGPACGATCTRCPVGQEGAAKHWRAAGRGLRRTAPVAVYEWVPGSEQRRAQ